MLTQMRKGASSWPAKIFLGVIALSFVGWGVGDVFVNRGGTTVADVGSAEVDIRDLQIAYSNQARSFQSQGVQIEAGSDLAQALARVALDQLILDSLQSETGAEFGITIGTDTLREDILNNGLFFDDSGVFSPAVFAGTLSTRGLTEARYLGLLGGQIRESQLLNSLGAVPPVPVVLADSVFEYRHEQRVAELAVIPNEALVPNPEPAAGDLEKFLEANLTEYSAPEYRSVDFLLVYPDDLARNIELDEAQLRQTYDAAPGAWTRAETRLFQQMSFPTEDAANAAFEELQGGADFAQVAFDQTGVAAEELDLGWFAPGDLFPELAGPLFAAPVGDAVAPLASPLGGWLIFRATDMTPEQVTPYEEARDAIATSLSLRMARDAMFGLANDMDDLLATGANVAETAAALELDARSLTRVSSFGATEDPMSLQIIPDAPEFLDEIYFGDIDFPSPVIETSDGGLLVVEVTEIVEARLRGLDEVEGHVLADWREQKLAELAGEAARSIADVAGIMGELNAAYSETGVSFDTLTPFVRTQAPGIDNVGLETVAALFEARPGEIVITPSVDGQHQVVARLLDIVSSDPIADPEGLLAVEQSLTNGLISDVVDQNTAAMYDSTSVSINSELLEEYF
ncbi:MAG: SurA N-terminal domain-containing protein [Alphaproteobacteria bacterium]|jgi:peptidyl-prolyl cis-trans isomerase D|nr:hypothetical protein [Rhodospirillaceae bacterium]MBT7615028.1 hypothetical protein [Rhodospirillaceae bacterium]MBT7646410.1 hypothetical protein [Rhodospirillaceae bacterium]MDG2481901.1 SurA N-terminal domain-containing protein [Alphaproteobacteria bacterium]